jgi:hypothetical protein
MTDREHYREMQQKEQEEHQERCSQAALALLKAAALMLEASGYSWSALSRRTIEEALVRADRGRELAATALAGTLPTAPASVPGNWPVSS